MQSTTLPPATDARPMSRPRAARPHPPRPKLTGEREGTAGAEEHRRRRRRALERGGHGTERTSSVAETAAMAGSGRRVPHPSPLPRRCGPPPSPFLCRRERRRRWPLLATSPRLPATSARAGCERGSSVRPGAG
ncbi:hypothetical protein PVAP13_7KG122581 [Panicum virgatum]|uniref:Uncharacterized protein n=1 Tax=Panicum virgatum TaxID=38727 RepID=A0A8T0QA18_PANVG|nr:hypothetical protein PVAP13_7KG122581 [Panicum virgatum]KAG2571868.1 hypothetical protein PVAP13_7KG122581 [Panicum virgatum]KAG2571869.1 hypothetical protein PVAP13_7KG122581 [Panicum virgatum]